MISVPYRGATFLNRAWELVKKSAMTDFRPLSGSYISQSNVLSEYVKNVNFRPLSGSYISQSGRLVHYIARYTISVPYRGATFLNRPLTARTEPEKNFRPLSGSYISQLHHLILHRQERKFPSPIGELHFSIPSPQPHVLSGTNRGIAGEK